MRCTLVALLLLAGCRAESVPSEQPLKLDPAIVAALYDPIMIDPDLVTQNRGDAAITRGGFDELPLEVQPSESSLAESGN